MAKTDTALLDPFQKEFIILLEENSRRHHKHEVFRDFCELAALTISCTVDLQQRDEREARYIQIIDRYDHTETERFSTMLYLIVESLTVERRDSLAQIFMSLELEDHWKGQFFNPCEIGYMMAKMTRGDVCNMTQPHGLLTANEAVAGASAMVIALANTVQEKGLNDQDVMHVTAKDIDEIAVHMVYIQLSLLRIPAIVLHGNSLWSENMWEHWVTPSHVAGS